ncbi:MAG: aminopeptidase [Firmicutes bacterium]|jgi:aminopeptidase|nr:aminopeptidase [Bacillota bacterium]
MIDPRLVKMAEVLIDYSLELKPGDKFLIESTDLATPLIKEVYRTALLRGAHPEVQQQVEGLSRILYTTASDEQLRYVSPLREKVILEYDAFLSIQADYNTKDLTNVDANKMALRRQAMAPLNQRFMERAAQGEMRWCVALYPTQGLAQEAAMSLDEYADFVMEACLLNTPCPVAAWQDVHDKQQRYAEFLNGIDLIEVKAKDTDLRLSVKGRTWENCDGKMNFPDGEVFTAPIEDSVEGVIRFSFPGIYSGKEVEDIRLTFKEGKVVEATAAKGEELLHSLLETDEGARRVGEFAIGTNFGITKFTRNMLFDEKIGGTIHLALGSTYYETGGKNESGIHWDMLCDMRDGGEIYADGKLIYRNGKMLIDK